MTGDLQDNMFLECADAARADYLVTGNVRHFPKFWKKTKVITSREFLSLVAPHVSGQLSDLDKLAESHCRLLSYTD